MRIVEARLSLSRGGLRSEPIRKKKKCVCSRLFRRQSLERYFCPCWLVIMRENDKLAILSSVHFIDDDDHFFMLMSRDPVLEGVISHCMFFL
jgi:hypothetical protein